MLSVVPSPICPLLLSPVTYILPFSSITAVFSDDVSLFPIESPIINASSSGCTLCTPTLSGLSFVTLLLDVSSVSPCVNCPAFSFVPIPSSPLVFPPSPYIHPFCNIIVVVFCPVLKYFTGFVFVTVSGNIISSNIAV